MKDFVNTMVEMTAIHTELETDPLARPARGHIFIENTSPPRNSLDELQKMRKKARKNEEDDGEIVLQMAQLYISLTNYKKAATLLLPLLARDKWKDKIYKIIFQVK